MEKSKVRLFNENLPNRADRIFDDQSGILFWDDISNKAYYGIYQTLVENFWIPDEVSMAQDRSDWHNKMSDQEKEVYKKAIGVLSVLDSIATQFDMYAFYFVKDPAIKATLANIAFMESIHNQSYTYNLTSLVPIEEAAEAFKHPKELPTMLDRNKIMMDIFDDFIEKQDNASFLKSLVAMSVLEGICFTNGFTPFYHFNRNGKMNGAGQMIRFIQRDEVQHSMFQSLLVRDIMTQYPEENTEEFSSFVYEFMQTVVSLEKAFCDDLYEGFYDIDILAVKQYVEYKANTLLDLYGFDSIFETKKNPMDWITAYSPENFNNVKSDFFEQKENNYAKVGSSKNESGDVTAWDDL